MALRCVLLTLSLHIAKAQESPVPYEERIYPSEEGEFTPVYSHGRIQPVLCYVDKYAQHHAEPMNYGMNDVDTRMCSHISYAFAEIENSTWRVKEHQESFGNFTALKVHVPRLKVLLSVGGWSNQTEIISAMALTRRSRRRFIEQVIKTLTTFDFDGLDIFWLYPGYQDRGGRREDKRNFVRLVKELRNAFEIKGLDFLLTAGVSLAPYFLDNGYDIYELDRYLDWMSGIGYELRGKWFNEADIHSPLYPRSIDPVERRELNVKDGMRDLMDRGAHKRKLFLGLAFYGRVYSLLNDTNNGLRAPIDKDKEPRAGPYVNSTEIYSYAEVCLALKNKAWIRNFDSEGKCPYAYYKDEWVGYEDVESIGYKMDC